MDKIVQTLRLELAELEAELQARQQKIQHIKELLALYEMPTGQQQPGNVTPGAKGNGREMPPGNLTKNERMEEGVLYILRANGEMHRRAIVDYLTAQRIMGGEKNPVGHLAAFLSLRRDLFVSDGHGNFRLTESASTGGR
jgi:hypothetical protein